jgi:hypothetical protein
MRRPVMRALLAAAALLVACTEAATQSERRETPAEIRRIVAQAICLGEAYAGSPIASDGADVVAVYQGTLSKTVTPRDLDAVRALAKAAKPAALTPVGNRNFAIARCVLFADRPDVVKLLGGGN